MAAAGKFYAAQPAGPSRYFPEFGVVLEGGPGGTLVTMRYNFAKADMKGPLCFLAKCMPDLLKWHLHGSIGSVWHMEMVSENGLRSTSARASLLT